MDSTGRWKYTMKKMGEPRVSAKHLEDKFQEFNLMYFNDELKHCTIKFDTLELHGAWGIYSCKNNAMCRYGIENALIIIDINATYAHDILLRNILLHEMIHMYVDEVLHLGNIEPAHGKTFRKIRRELNRLYNLRIDDKQIYSELPMLSYTI